DQAHAPIATGIQVFNPGTQTVGTISTLNQGLSIQSVHTDPSLTSNNVRIVSKVNRVTNKVSVEPGELTFDLNEPAHLSTTIEGTPARNIDDPRDPGNVIATFTNLPFDPGHYQTLLIPQNQLALPGIYHYTLTATDDQGNPLMNDAGQPV